MNDSFRVELPLRAPSKILSTYSTIGDLKKAYPGLSFVKYIYKDPKDGKIKGANPPLNLPLVHDAYITVIGGTNQIIKFTEEATPLIVR